MPSESQCECCEFWGHFEGLCPACQELYDEAVREARAARKHLEGMSLARSIPSYVTIGGRRFCYE